MNAIITIQKLPNGLTPLLSKHLDLQALAKHKATLSLELEVLAKKFDRFGWERDRQNGSASQDRMILDWMDALQDYPLDEVRAACRAAVLSNPNKMPNEGHVRQQIITERKSMLARQPKAVVPATPTHTVSADQKARADAMVAGVGRGLRP